jgi:hypothetical protein
MRVVIEGKATGTFTNHPYCTAKITQGINTSYQSIVAECNVPFNV